MMDGTAKWLAGAFAAMVAAVLAGCVVALGTGVAGAADIGGVEDPHIAEQIERERRAAWSVYGGVVGGGSASASDIRFDDGTSSLSLDGVSGDNLFLGGRIGVERRWDLLVLGVFGEAGAFGEDEAVISGSLNGDSAESGYSADWYWITAATLGVYILPRVQLYGLAGYGEIETGDIAFDDVKLGDPDLGGAVFGGGVAVDVSDRFTLRGEARKLHDFSGDAGDVSLDSGVWQGVIGGFYRF